MNFPSINRPIRAAAFILVVAGHDASALVVQSVNGPLTVSNSSGPVQIGFPRSNVRINSTANSTSPFQIMLNYSNAPTPSQQAVFNAAKATWESLITGWKDTVGISSVSITVNLENIDGPGNILGSAGPDTGIITPNYLYTTSGSMTFDTSDIPGLGAAFGDVVLHEMGHVLGIGTLWSASFATGGFVTGRQEVYVNNSGQYTGAYGLAAYNAEFGQSGAFIPVELGGGPGTANGHWNEVDGGAGLTGIVGPQGDFRNELMTGWLNAPSYISNTTVQSLQDIGFNVIPEPAPFALVALGGLLMVRRRRE
jgi:hypothetical protein